MLFLEVRGGCHVLRDIVSVAAVRERRAEKGDAVGKRRAGPGELSGESLRNVRCLNYFLRLRRLGH